MQDFDRKLQRKNSEMPITKHPEYAMYLSTRDMARLGLLMLTDGAWRDSQVMPKGWARRITTLVTHQDEIHPLTVGAYRTQGARWGYGMLVWDEPDWPGTVTGPLSRRVHSDRGKWAVHHGATGDGTGGRTQSQL